MKTISVQDIEGLQRAISLLGIAEEIEVAFDELCQQLYESPELLSALIRHEDELSVWLAGILRKNVESGNEEAIKYQAERISRGWLDADGGWIPLPVRRQRSGQDICLEELEEVVAAHGLAVSTVANWLDIPPQELIENLATSQDIRDAWCIGEYRQSESIKALFVIWAEEGDENARDTIFETFDAPPTKLN